MDIQEYIVTLGIRPSEINGLKELPGSSKNSLTPIVLLAPWLATVPLSRALMKFEEAFPDRPYLLDVDTYYQPGTNVNEAKEQWAELNSKPANLNLWWELLSKFPYAQPCLLMAEQPIEKVREQINWARENDRTFCIRINLADGIGSGFPLWMPDLINELVVEGAIDYCVVFEFGWVPDPLILSVIASGYFQNFFSKIPPEIAVAVSCTSFPKDFTPFHGLENHKFANRELIAQIRQTTNHPKIIYGDWGTTRPRNYGHASPPKHRIDYPTDTSWVFSRDQDESISLHEAAKRLVDSEFWSGNLGIWGEKLIQDTADGLPFAIDTMQKMYAARINIHLHRQAFYGNLPPPEALDEEWVD